MSLQSKIPFSSALLGILVFTLAAPSSAQVTQSDLQTKADQALLQHDVVGIGVAVITADLNVPVIVVAGERRRGSGDMIDPNDAWHIGSNTKILTALTYAKLVERGDARWGATLPDLFPHIRDEMHADWETVTIEDLLAHRSGLEPNPGPFWMLSRIADERPLNVQRAEFARKSFTKPAKGEGGEFAYSNTGYILAGAAITSIATQNLDLTEPVSFEWVFPHLFANNLTQIGGEVGFGPPQDGIEGHEKALFGNRLKPAGSEDTDDNPAIFGPAGTMHIDLRTHALFLAQHFISGDDTIRQKLLTPYPNSDSDYALGWGLGEREGIGRIYGHSGSNTMWLSNVTYAPSLDAIVIVNINQFNDDARAAVKDVTNDILDQLLEAK